MNFWFGVHDCLASYLNMLLLTMFVLNCNVIFRLSYNILRSYEDVPGFIEGSSSIVCRLYFVLAKQWHLLLDWSFCCLDCKVFLVMIFFLSRGLFLGWDILPVGFSMLSQRAMISLLNLLVLIIRLWYFPLICSQ